MRRSGAAGLVVATLLLTADAASAQAPLDPAAPDAIRYAFKPGDNLFDLGQRYFTRPTDYLHIARLNRVRQPRRMPIGTSVRIPVALLRTAPVQARVANFRGAVTIAQGGAATPALVDRAVSEGAVITTGPNAFLRLALSDGGHVTIPSRSRVRITRLRTILLTGAVDQEIRIESGRIESEVAPVRAPGGFSIRTPVSVSSVRGTEFRVSYDAEAERSATEVIKGVVGVATGDAAIVATADQGVSAGSDGVRLAALLPAPELVDPDAVLTAREAVFEVAPVSGAARYRARLATDAGMVDAFAEADGVSGEGRVVFPDLADGAYFVRVSAIAPDGMEGVAAVYSALRARNGLGGLAAITSGVGRHRRYLFRWVAEGAGEARFRFQLRLAGSDAPAVIDEVDLDQPRITLTGLPPAVYEWRVRSTRRLFGRTLEVWSEPQQLHIGR